jgi:class 3 adenylate cyclase/tetratricopeptide (TPR) repeat protein
VSDLRCVACGTENEQGRKFCLECGTPLASTCPACGSSNTPEAKFCGECGGALTDGAPARAPVEAATAERRLVSILFADLVGFTTLSESRDSEEVRELLSRYFDTCRRLIELYGGTVEKFIGDAVMAVWGTPTATEDDAERAVRAALDLVAAVTALGDEAGEADLRARAGVLTGEAAVTVGAEGQGMVAGDLVNTASRIQSLAEPGTVLVGEPTRRATDQAIVYVDAGSHELKGKVGLFHLSRALRVVSGVGGSLKQSGLEAPFVGRDGELRRIKDLFHAGADDRKQQLVSITGIAGIGKSRLAWEFYKYFDGLSQIVYWHRGRCLSYGEGVAYWALADMVRMRARIAEDEDPASADEKLAEVVREHVPDDEERRFVEPRLRHLLGLEESTRFERDDLFAAWRLFFERLADVYPVVMVFEDMQWADTALLDFIEYLLEWSRGSPLFVVTLARPELLDRRPTWGAASRNLSSIYLEPLPAPAMEALLDGLAPGLPESTRRQILDRAEGIPLYAVETVRMLLDRGVLVQEGAVYRPTGTIESLEVPETLHALIAARLDGLSPEERGVIQDAAVIGKTFTKAALAALRGTSEPDLDPLLSSLVRKEVLTLQADPRSPERGQYGFLQDLLKRVAYETLSKKERRARHLAAADHLEQAFATDAEIVEVVASHYVSAYESGPDAPDAGQIKQKAHELIARAAERAASLAAPEEAQRYFDQAAELADDPLERARLLERAGEMAWTRFKEAEAEERYRRSLELFEGSGETHPAARVAARLAEVEWQTGRLDEGLARMERAFEVLAGDEPDEDFAILAAQLGRLYFFRGELDLAKQRVEAALAVAESHWLPGLLADALVSEANVSDGLGRPEKALALTRHALELALEHDITSVALRASYNLVDLLRGRDRYEEALAGVERALALARKVGNRRWERSLNVQSLYILAVVGRLEEARELLTSEFEGSLEVGGTWGSAMLAAVPVLDLASGTSEQTARCLAAAEAYESSVDFQDRSSYSAAKAFALRQEGANAEALAWAEQALQAMAILGAVSESVKNGFGEAVEAALALGDLDKAEELIRRIEDLRAGAQPPFLRAQAARFRARLSTLRGHDDGVAQQFKNAEQIFREYGIPFWLALAQLEHAEWLDGHGRNDDAGPLAAEAREIFERLGATPWIERASGLGLEVPA